MVLLSDLSSTLGLETISNRDKKMTKKSDRKKRTATNGVFVPIKRVAVEPLRRFGNAFEVS